MAARSRDFVLNEINETHGALRRHYNEVLLDEMRQLLHELSELNKDRWRHDDQVRRIRMRDAFIQWSEKYQQVKDKHKQQERQISLLPRTQAVCFNGVNGQAFWASLEATVLCHSHLSDYEKMCRLIAGVSSHTGAAAVVGRFPLDGSRLYDCLASFKEHYLNPRDQRAALLKQAQEVPRLSNFKDAEVVSVYLTRVRLIATQVDGVLEAEDGQLMTIMRELLMKLPEEPRAEFYKFHLRRQKYNSSPEFNSSLMDSLLAFVEEEDNAATLRRYVEGSSR